MEVVHLKKSTYTVYIGRPTIFGNPFPIGDSYTRDEAVAAYEEYARSNKPLLKAIKELSEDDILGCWCHPRKCHGDIVIKLWGEMNP